MVETIGGEILITTQGGYLVFDGPAKILNKPHSVSTYPIPLTLGLEQSLRNPDGS